MLKNPADRQDLFSIHVTADSTFQRIPENGRQTGHTVCSALKPIDRGEKVSVAGLFHHIHLSDSEAGSIMESVIVNASCPVLVVK
jgi:hypothetical protein